VFFIDSPILILVNPLTAPTLLTDKRQAYVHSAVGRTVYLGLKPWTIDATMVVFQCPQVDWQCQPHFAFQQFIRVQSWNKNLKKKCTNLNQINVRKPLLLYVSQRREDLKLYLEPGLEIGKFQPRSKKAKMITFGAVPG
jgi:hypothetical protein